MDKLSLAVIFGGASSEHEVSCVSAASVIENLDTSKYDIHKIGIDKDGSWIYYRGNTGDMAKCEWQSNRDNRPCFISPDSKTQGFYIVEDSGMSLVHIDAVFPVMHGKFGEDGTIQGLFEMADIPYVGCGCAASAVCMDKALTNALLDNAEISQAKWLWFTKDEYASDRDTILDRTELTLGYPCFIKPANAGSSVGIGKAKNRDQLAQYIENALIHDKRIVIEEGIDGIEVECAVLGNERPFASVVGEIVPANEFYDYEAKYKNAQSLLYIPARIDEALQDKIRETAVRAYRAMGCEGLSRVDFFVRKCDNAVLLNEINTMPGFTSISMYPKLMDKSGIAYSELLDKLIAYAFERKDRV